MRRRLLALGFALSVVAAVPLGGPASGQTEETVLAYTIREARAYAFRVSLRKEVIEAAQNAQPCDPEEDPYRCDDAAYNHEPNCPASIAVGGKAVPIEPEGLSEANVLEGGAGDETGAGARPPLASPITINEQLTIGRLGDKGGILEAGGLATDGYVDLSGRQEPEMHTESDAFIGNRAELEERCGPPDEVTEDSYKHFFSWSSETPETYHLAECFNDHCIFDQLTFSADTVHARTVVHLVEEDGVIRGLLEARFQDASWGDGQLQVKLLETNVAFESDGTPDGLAWSVSSRAVGARLNGYAVTIPEGRLIGSEEFQVGFAAPFVQAPGDGSALKIVAPGLMIATPEQTAFLAGAELQATMSREKPFAFLPGIDEAVPPPSGGGAPGPGVAIGGGLDEPTGTGAPSEPASGEAAAPEPVVSVQEVTTGAWPVAVTLGLGLLGLLLVLSRWLGRFAWGRRLFRVQPFRTFDWIYRAFVKT